jgi:hypothetical protein
MRFRAPESLYIRTGTLTTRIALPISVDRVYTSPGRAGVASPRKLRSCAASRLRLPSSRPGDPIRNIVDRLRTMPLIKGKLGKSCTPPLVLGTYATRGLPEMVVVR